jgi:DNA topoisomerase-3
MKLYICEKFSVGKALAGVLPGVTMRDKDFIRCGEDIVAWASGHLLELCEPEDYDGKLKTWGRDTLLYVPDKWRLKVKERTKGLFSCLSKLIHGLGPSDIVVNVGDGDREGQTLIDEILEHCGWHGHTKRLRLNDVNPDAIRKALSNMRDNAEFQGEYRAGKARMYADWLVGLPMTRFVTVSLREAGYDVKAMSVGRVQTPTLGLVVMREREIREFVPSPYFDFRAALTLNDGRRITGRWVPGENHGSILDEQKRITDGNFIRELAASLEGKNGEITSVTKQTRRSSPLLPYSLPKLQMAASKKYDMTDTLAHVQKLYESGYVTYPRTECEHIPEGHFAEAGKILDAIRSGCPSLSDMLDGADSSRKSAAWDDTRITEHHAILPTAKVPLDGALTEMERKIYELVCARYVLQFLADYEYEETVVEFGTGGEVFRAVGRTVVNLGWQGWDRQDEKNDGETWKQKGVKDSETEEKDEDDGDKRDSQVLPSVHKGEPGVLRSSVEEKLTKPPKPYTYHALLAAMNGIHAFVENPDIRAKLKEVQGIGTAATQESIISTLFERGYIEKKKKIIQPTDLGRLLICLLSDGRASVMVRPDLTALWERTMSDIEAGSASLESFVSEVAGMVRGIISDRLNIPEDVPSISGMECLHKCLTPGCEGFLRHIAAKTGKNAFFSCPVCHLTFNAASGTPVAKKERPDGSGEVIEAPCPMSCGGNARRYEGRYGPFWKCACSPDVTFKDSGGVPAVREARVEAPCPAKGCKGKAVRFAGKKDGRPFWKCGMCDNFFDDFDGKPALRRGKSKR